MNRKTIIIALLALVAMAGQGQTFTPIVEDSIDFVITGTTATEADSITWWPCAPWGSDHLVPVENGQFRVAGYLPRHTFIQIEDLHFIIEETPTHVNLETCDATGSDMQRRFLQIQKEEQKIEKAMWGELTDDEQMRVMQMCSGEVPMTTTNDSMWVRRYDAAWDSIYVLRAQRYRENLDNYLPAYYLFVNHMHIPLEEFGAYMHEDAPYAHHPAMSHVWKQYWGLQEKHKITGNIFRDFEAETTDSVLHFLSEYAGRGKYVLLDFWASWCGPCIAAFPMMKQLHESYANRGLRIIGISIDEDGASWRKAVEKHNLPWLQVHETAASKTNRSAASDLYRITAVPTLVLIAPNGKVLSTDLEGEILKTKLAEIFGE
ncbi:MAG: TlpA family protein disulfide reductase [Bacteroidaceae bacterium]|nr:TlpA family protein disulfide reductase [Bacteroidaceae bacterium]